MEKLSIRKIYLNEIESFSESYAGKFNDLPISSKRIRSYVNNPNKNLEKPVLYLGLLDGQMVTYRSVLQDIFYTNSNQLANAIWVSGSWTHPDHRRKGLSDKIFDEVSKDYDQSIFITNYGNESKGLYSRRKELINYRSLDGHRFYYRLPLEKLLPPKSRFFLKIKTPLKIIDSLGNLFLDLRFNFYKCDSNLEIYESEMNDELAHFISKHNHNSLFRRNVGDFKWILDFPWVEQKSKDGQQDRKYYFTTTASRFYQKSYIVKSYNQIKGFLFYSVKNEEMKIHYIFCESIIGTKAFSEFILNEIRTHKISYLITTDAKLIQVMKDKRGFLFSKAWKKGYFAGNRLVEEHPEILEKEIYMGDGDTIFT